MEIYLLDGDFMHKHNVFLFLCELSPKQVEVIDKIYDDGNTTIYYNCLENKLIERDVDECWNKIFDYNLSHNFIEINTEFN